MKITISINTGSKLTSIDLYPKENVLWIRTNGTLVEKKISSEQAETLKSILTGNFMGRLVEVSKPRVSFIEKITSNKGVINEP